MDSDTLDAIRDRFDQKAATYDENQMHVALALQVAGFCELHGVRAVLDVATGTGLLLRALRGRPESQGVLLSGVDLSPGMLEVARAQLPEADLLEGDATRLPFADNSVDLITCVTALHLLQQPAEAFAEWVRVLVPDGRLVTATFTRKPRRSKDAAPLPFPSDHDSYRTPEQIGAAFAPVGMRVARYEEWAYAEDPENPVEVLICELRSS